VAAKLCGARVVFHIPHQGRAANWLLRLADVIVLRSHDEREAYEASLPGRYIAVVPQGIDPAPYLRYNRRAPDPLTPLKLLHFGEQGHALEALARLREEGLQCRLTIAGSGPQTLLRSRARELGLSGEITFAAPAWDDYKAKLLRDADVLLVASEDSEALEGMAAGVVPVVMSAGPDAVAKAIAALDADRAELARRSHACRQRVQCEHSLERMADDFSAIYSVLIPWPASQAG
jgi:glycosyltransferase involved in cell wall biosynthesis